MAEIHTRDGNSISEHDGTFTLYACARRYEWASRYVLTIPLEGTGLKTVVRPVDYDPRVREVDVGDIYMEGVQEPDAEKSEKRSVTGLG